MMRFDLPDTEPGTNLVLIFFFFCFQGALFESCHYDENDVQTISHKCEVVDFHHFRSKVNSDPGRLGAIYDNNDFYYLAGRHDPVEGTIDFEEGVLSD